MKTAVAVTKLLLIGVIAVSLAAIAILIALRVFDPFGSDTVDRSGPTVLERIRTLEEFTAAEAVFVQDVDIEEDTRFLPGFLSGERVVAIVDGAVRATVEFGDLDEESVQVDEESGSISITLPSPELREADIDEQSVRVVARDRGLADRLGDVFVTNPTDDSPVFERAVELMNAAAKESNLTETARANTEQWFVTLMGAAGFETVDVTWQ